MASSEDLKNLKVILREEEIPYFSDEELNFHLDKDRNFKKTVYNCLIIKSESGSLNITGLSLADTSSYFRRLAVRYRPNKSGILKGS